MDAHKRHGTGTRGGRGTNGGRRTLTLSRACCQGLAATEVGGSCTAARRQPLRHTRATLAVQRQTATHSQLTIKSSVRESASYRSSPSASTTPRSFHGALSTQMYLSERTQVNQQAHNADQPRRDAESKHKTWRPGRGQGGGHVQPRPLGATRHFHVHNRLSAVQQIEHADQSARVIMGVDLDIKASASSRDPLPRFACVSASSMRAHRTVTRALTCK